MKKLLNIIFSYLNNPFFYIKDQKEYKKTVMQVFNSSLTVQEGIVLVLRLDLGLTLENVSFIIGVTRERVRQVEAKALRKLRHPKRRQYFEKYLLEK